MTQWFYAHTAENLWPLYFYICSCSLLRHSVYWFASSLPPANSLSRHLTDHALHLTLRIPTGHLITESEFCDAQICPGKRDVSHWVEWIDNGLDCRGVGFRFSVRTRDFSFLHNVQTGPGSTQRRIKLIHEAFPHGKNGRGLELTTKCPSSAEVKNGGVIPPLPDTSSWHLIN
jgi:hypothetical protein